MVDVLPKVVTLPQNKEEDILTATTIVNAKKDMLKIVVENVSNVLKTVNIAPKRILVISVNLTICSSITHVLNGVNKDLILLIIKRLMVSKERN